MNEIEKYKPFLKNKLNAYCQVSDASIALIAAIAKVQDLAKGEVLLPLGKIAKQKHLLYKGAIVATFMNSNGDCYHKNIFLENDFVGSTVSAIKRAPSNFALEAIENSVVISFDYQKYRALIAGNAELKNFYIAYLEKNWVVDKEKRELDIVLKDASERYLDFMMKHPDVEQRIPLRYIASHLGITPTQLSRIRREMKEKSAHSTYVK